MVSWWADTQRRSGFGAVAVAVLLTASAAAQDRPDPGPMASGPDPVVALALDLFAEGDGDGPLTTLCGLVDGPPCAPDVRVQRLQDYLVALGLDPGPADGIYGPRTASALLDYLRQTGQTLDLLPREDLLGAEDPGSTTGLLPDLRQPPMPSTVEFSGAITHPSTRPLALASPVPTRAFAGPDQFPPAGFRGYGFLAFPASATEYDRDRHMILCQSYVSSMATVGEVAEPTGDQFVTVWPVLTAAEADALNPPVLRSDAAAVCQQAIAAYDVNRARDVIAMVRSVNGVALEGRGPFLFGWLPASDFGTPGRLILLLDLSRVTTYEQALTQMQSWRQQVETNPDLLRDGFSVENLRRLLRDWADRHGEDFLRLIGGA